MSPPPRDDGGMNSSAGAGGESPRDREDASDVQAAPPHDGATGEPAPAPSTTTGPPSTTDRTRISAAWAAAIVGALILVLLLIFILQNQDGATVSFLGMAGSLPLGVALLLAAVAGALLVALLGAARMLQLRRRIRHPGGSKTS